MLNLFQSIMLNLFQYTLNINAMNPNQKHIAMNLQSFLSFNKMITPSIITVIYYILLTAVILGGLFTIFAGLGAPFGGGGMAFTGILVLFLGPVLVRVYCEILIVLFKIHGRLASVDETLKRENINPGHVEKML